MGKLRIFREIFTNLKHRKPAKKYCPKCGDPKIKLLSKFNLWVPLERYVCERCGYQGPIVLEREEEAQEE